MSASKDGMGEGVFRGHSQRNRKFVEFEPTEDDDDESDSQGSGLQGLCMKHPSLMANLLCPL